MYVVNHFGDLLLTNYVSIQVEGSVNKDGAKPTWTDFVPVH